MTARKVGKLGLIIKIVSFGTWIPIIVGKILPPGMGKNGVSIDNLATQWFMGLIVTIFFLLGGYLLYLLLAPVKEWWDD